MMSKSSLTMKVSITDTEIFNELLGVLKSIIEDERIDTNIRLELKKKLVTIGEKAEMRV